MANAGVERAFPAAVLLTLLLLSGSAVADSDFSRASGYNKTARYTNQFQSWFPQYGYIWSGMLRDNCSQQYETYKTGIIDMDKVDWRGGGGTNTGGAQPVVQCLLINASEYLKAVMTGGQVILGVTPTILSVLSASSEEFSALAVIGRRPVLAMLLGLGSPCIYLGRAFEAWDPPKLLRCREHSFAQPVPPATVQPFVWALQYVLAICSIVNIALLTWEIGLKTIVAMWTDMPIGPTIWTVFIMPVHLLGVWCMFLRADRRFAGEDNTLIPRGSTDSHPGLRQRILSTRWIQRLWCTETTLCIAQPQIDVKNYDETPLFIFLSWFVSTAIIGHLVLGTVIFSNTLFLGPKDALSITGRYMASVFTCRAVLVYELAGIRTACFRTVNARADVSADGCLSTSGNKTENASGLTQ